MLRRMVLSVLVVLAVAIFWTAFCTSVANGQGRVLVLPDGSEISSVVSFDEKVTTAQESFRTRSGQSVSVQGEETISTRFAPQFAVGQLSDGNEIVIDMVFLNRTQERRSIEARFFTSVGSIFGTRVDGEGGGFGEGNVHSFSIASGSTIIGTFSRCQDKSVPLGLCDSQLVETGWVDFTTTYTGGLADVEVLYFYRVKNSLDDVVTTEGVPLMEATDSRLLMVANFDNEVFGNQQTGVALVNFGNESIVVNFHLSKAGIPFDDSAGVTLEPGQQRAFFVHDLFPEAPFPMVGNLRVESMFLFAIVSLRVDVGEAGEYSYSNSPTLPGMVSPQGQGGN